MSLKNSCIKIITRQIKNAPPEIQEEIIDSTKEHIRQSVFDEIFEELEDDFSLLVPIMLKERETIYFKNLDTPYTDYDKEFPAIHSRIIRCAILATNAIMLSRRY